MTNPQTWPRMRLRFALQRGLAEERRRALESADVVTFVPMEAIGEQGELDMTGTRVIDDVRNGYTQFFDGDVVVAKITPCFENGKGAVVRGTATGVGFGTTELHVLSPGPTLDAKFLYYVTVSAPFRMLGKAGMTGAAGQKRVPEDFVRDYEVALPPLEEQRAIAEDLDRETAQLDALVAAKERVLRLLAERRRALVTRAVTRGLDEGAPTRDSGIPWLGQVPAHWPVDRLKWSTASIVGGVWGEEPDGANDIVCIRVADFNRTRLTVAEDPPTKRSISVRDRLGRVLRPGDLLLEKSGGGESQPVGRAVLFDGSYAAVCSNFVARVTLRDGMYAPYWVQMHATLYEQRLNVVNTKQTTGIQNLDVQAYFDVQVPFPSYEEQQDIAAYIAVACGKLDGLRAATERTLALLRERRAALITAAVTGALQLPDGA